MIETKEILTIELPANTPFKKWSDGVGKSTIFTELLIGCEELLYNDLDKVYCFTIIPNGRRDNIDFVVRRGGIENTLNKIMSWGIENEQYLMCSRVKELQSFIHEPEKIT